MADDITGKTFGLLTAMAPHHRDPVQRGWFWRCVCVCGREKITRKSALIAGKVLTCGHQACPGAVEAKQRGRRAFVRRAYATR